MYLHKNAIIWGYFWYFSCALTPHYNWLDILSVDLAVTLTCVNRDGADCGQCRPSGGGWSGRGCSGSLQQSGASGGSGDAAFAHPAGGFTESASRYHRE